MNIATILRDHSELFTVTKNANVLFNLKDNGVTVMHVNLGPIEDQSVNRLMTLINA